MGNCLNSSTKKNRDKNGKDKCTIKQNLATNEKHEGNSKQNSSKKQTEAEESSKKPKYTQDKYGRKIPVLSDVKESNLMMRRLNSKDEIINENN